MLLRAEGRIDTADYQRTIQSLSSRGQTAHSPLTRSILQGPIYVDHLALSYLQDAGILQPMAAAGLGIQIHPSVLEEVNALIEARRCG